MSSRHRFTPRHYKPANERRPAPSHRHGQPSAPWPWVNIYDEVDGVQLASRLPPIPPLCDHINCGGCWRGYPQNRFPNWTPSQVKRSGIHTAIHAYPKNYPTIIHQVDVDDNGFFTDLDKIIIRDEDQRKFWEELTQNARPPNLRVRALFIEDMSGPVLQMLGAKYNIEPFFFSSSLSWIPSRFQEEVRPGLGDHITVTLTFIRMVESTLASEHSANNNSILSDDLDQGIDTQAPLLLNGGARGDSCYLVLDLLAVHLIRNTSGNTIISYHSPHGTSAPYLHERIRFAGQSVYWQSIFQKSSDPTFVLLTFMWHALYAWDEALERLYSHICWLEGQVLKTNDLQQTQELHHIRAHHLYFASLLEDFRKSIIFIRDTPNPAMDALTEDERSFSQNLLKRECNNLVVEVDRLDKSRAMQESRLQNVMNLLFSKVNIMDSRLTAKMTAAALRDSAVMKQIAFLSMIFLPASFMASVFGMNVQEINPGTFGTLVNYAASTLSLTFFTIWVVMTFQIKYLFGEQEQLTIWMRLMWPILLFRYLRDRADRGMQQEQDEFALEQWYQNVV